MGLHPGCAQGQGRGQSSHDTGSFVISGKSLLLAGKWCARVQGQLSRDGMSYCIIDGLGVIFWTIF